MRQFYVNLDPKNPVNDFTPKVTLCNKCGLPIKFKKLASGKWCPTNTDGSDHWDLCKRTTRKAEGPVVTDHGVTKATDLRLPPWDGVGNPFD